MALKALVLTGFGINCEAESKFAIEKSGGNADILHLNRLLEKPATLQDYNMLMIPGGFAFGDDLGSGRVYGNKMRYVLRDHIEEFVSAKKLVLGICNGFQVLVKMGLLPEPDFTQRVSLIANDSGKFEDRWVILRANKLSPCIFTKDIGHILLPVRHGEGKFVTDSPDTLDKIKKNNQIVFQYVDGQDTLAEYPHNPNGAIENIAGICDQSGRVFGMMPHPEGFNIPENCPYWTTTTVKEGMGLRIFKNAVDFAKEEDI